MHLIGWKDEPNAVVGLCCLKPYSHNARIVLQH